MPAAVCLKKTPQSLMKLQVCLGVCDLSPTKPQYCTQEPAQTCATQVRGKAFQKPRGGDHKKWAWPTAALWCRILIPRIIPLCWLYVQRSQSTRWFCNRDHYCTNKIRDSTLGCPSTGCWDMGFLLHTLHKGSCKLNFKEGREDSKAQATIWKRRCRG